MYKITRFETVHKTFIECIVTSDFHLYIVVAHLRIFSSDACRCEHAVESKRERESEKRENVERESEKKYKWMYIL